MSGKHRLNRRTCATRPAWQPVAPRPDPFWTDPTPFPVLGAGVIAAVAFVAFTVASGHLTIAPPDAPTPSIQQVQSAAVVSHAPGGRR